MTRIQPEPALHLRITYSKPSTFDDGKPCRVCCAADDPEADEVEIETGQYTGSMRFKKHTETGLHPGEGYVKAGEWPRPMEELIRMLNRAFERGRNEQRRQTRDLFKEVMGL
jgi:hypothetical protein